MKKVLILAAVSVAFAACNVTPEKPEPYTPETSSLESMFTVNKKSWNIVTKAHSISPDANWEVGETVTVFCEDGSYKTFTVTETDGLNAGIECPDYDFIDGEKYKIFYPSLADGWLNDGEYVLTYGYLPSTEAHKVGDWSHSEWVTYKEDEKMSFELLHYNSMLALQIKSPQQGSLAECYIYIAKAPEKEYFPEVFGYKIQYLFNDGDFFVESVSREHRFPIIFDPNAIYDEGEYINSLTPIYTDDYTSYDMQLYLVYTDGAVFHSDIKLPEFEVSQCYSDTVLKFTRDEKEPPTNISW
ncbi:MAG: hypothetical protein MJY56_02815 [Bacteroidales bacterium]|nr:hypothetical protein [Bacteroidales bacterium]